MTTTAKSSLPIILASTSVYRQQVLNRLHLPFEIFAPHIDETPYPNEQPAALVSRLAQAKARSAQAEHPQALIIGSDQMAVLEEDGTVLGKPGDHDRAFQQLKRVSGKQVDFLTGLCLFNSDRNHAQAEVVRFSVRFRQLSESQIESYLHQDTPYNCSGSFKSEGLGIALLECMLGSDPTAVIGLPLIRLVQMLESEGVRVL